MEETAILERVWAFAGACRAAQKALDAIPSLPTVPALDALLEEQLYPSDLGRLGERAAALADERQAQIDTMSLGAKVGE